MGRQGKGWPISYLSFSVAVILTPTVASSFRIDPPSSKNKQTKKIVGVILVQKLCSLSLFACDTVPGAYIEQTELHFLRVLLLSRYYKPYYL
jgi:hypothetical protein